MARYDKDQFSEDFEKAKSREHARDFIRGFYNGATGGLRALFLTGPSLIEQDAVYTPLGLKPRNVHGAEIDPEVFQLVQTENQSRHEGERIKLHEGDVLEHLAGNGQYDIISLDWTQNYGPTIVKALDLILNPENPKLSTDGVLIINTQAKREHPKYQGRLAALVGLGGVTESERINRVGKSFAEKLHEDAEAFYNEEAKQRIREIYGDEFFMNDFLARVCGERINDKHYLEILRHGLFHEVNLRAVYPFLRGYAGKALEEMALEGEDLEVLNGLKNFAIGNPEEDLLMVAYLAGRIARDPNSAFDLALSVAEPNVQKLAESLETLDRAQGEKSKALIINDGMSRTITDYETGGYISESGTPMTYHLIGLRKDMLVKPGDSTWKGFISASKILSDASHSNEPRWKRFRKLLGIEGNPISVAQHIEQNTRANKSLGRIKGTREGSLVLDAMTRLRSGRVSSLILRATENLKKGTDVATKNLLTHGTTIVDLAEERNNYNESISQTLQPEETSPVQQNGLSESDKKAIRELFKEGNRPKQIYETFFADTEGVSVQQVSAICARTHDSWNKGKSA